jgi:hypothetical protein
MVLITCISIKHLKDLDNVGVSFVRGEFIAGAIETENQTFWLDANRVLVSIPCPLTRIDLRLIRAYGSRRRSHCLRCTRYCDKTKATLKVNKRRETGSRVSKINRQDSGTTTTTDGR